MKYYCSIFVLSGLLVVVPSVNLFSQSFDKSLPLPRHSIQSYRQLPLTFEANRSEGDGGVRFISRGGRYGLFLSSGEAVLTLRQPASARGEINGQERLTRRAIQDRTPTLRLKIVGGNPKPEMSGVDELPGKANYFVGNDPARWRTDVPLYAKVRCQDVYPGVDLVYYGNQSQLEYDFVVAPGAHPSVIALRIEESDGMRLNDRGDLLLKLGDETVEMRKPKVYQEINGVRKEVKSSYTFLGDGTVGFQIGDYNQALSLVIDPVLVYSTYLGGSGGDAGTDLAGIAVDSSGNAYVTGSTGSTNFPTNPPQAAHGGGDAYVTKYSPAGGLVYSTYLGGSSYESGTAIAVDNGGNAYVTGGTFSTNFPTAGGPVVSPLNANYSGYHGDAFVLKLNAAGNTLVYSTYLGGDKGYNVGLGIAVKGQNAYVTGYTDSPYFPVAGGAKVSPLQLGLKGVRDIFVAMFNVAGNALVYSTLIGGSGQGLETGNAIAVDGSGNAYVTGYIEDQAGIFPTVRAYDATPNGGGMDAFVLKLNAAGNTLLYSTYLGGSLNEIGWGIGVDFFGYAYVTGWTRSSDFPTKNAFQPALPGNGHAFLAKIDATANGAPSLIYSTYFGGNGGDQARAISVDSAGNACIVGLTSSTNLPLLNPLQSVVKGNYDMFVTIFNSNGSALLFSTYLGGITGYEEPYGVALDNSGSVYVTGFTDSTDFPTLNAAQPASGGAGDAFVLKISKANPSSPCGPTAAGIILVAAAGVTFVLLRRRSRANRERSAPLET